MPAEPVVERHTSNPVSLAELSLQVSPMAVVEVAVAERPLGATTGVEVVAHEPAESGDDGTMPAPMAFTL